MTDMTAPVSQQPKPSGPFGLVAQRELEYMSLCNFGPLDRLLLVVLRARVDGRTRKVHDRIDTLAYWSGLGTRSVQRSLASLEQRGTIARERHRISGGPRGHAFTWTTTLVPYDGWPIAPLERLVVVTTTYVRVFYPLEERATGASTSTSAGGKNTPEPTEEHARIGGRTRLATRHNPEASPEIYPESERAPEEDEDDARGAKLERPQRTPSGVTGGDASQERAGGGPDHRSRLIARWKSARRQIGLDRFTDALALTWLGQKYDVAAAAGCTTTDLDAAFRSHVDEDFADPREFDDWALDARARREELEAAQRFSREFLDRRDREARELDERIRAERADPDWQAKQAAIAASFRRSGIKTIGGVIEQLGTVEEASSS